MTGAPALASEPSPLPRLARALRPHLTSQASHIVAEMNPAHAHASAVPSPRYAFLSMAAQAAARDFLDTAEGRSDGGRLTRQVDELFRRIGHGEAQHDQSWENIVAALLTASRRTWRYLASYASTHDLTGHELRTLTDAAFDYLDRLRDRLAEGYALANRDSHREQQDARAHLMRVFLADPAPRPGPDSTLGIADHVLQAKATEAAWPLPDEAVVLAVSYHADPPAIPPDDRFLTQVEAGIVFIIAPSIDEDLLLTHIAQAGPGLRVAISWPVPPAESGSALRWCQRALDLVDLGVIAPTPVVRCAEHTTQLWLHAEPSMRQRLCQQLLAPLLAETPNSRTILSETLLTWVETHDSAPAIAARLDVHPQTVRYRWKRINELFGESLHDAEFVMQVALVLKASVPMWKAGNQSDFERFRDSLDAVR